MIAEIQLNGTAKVRAFALDLDEYCEFGLNEEDAPVQGWARYIFGGCTINLVKIELYDSFIAKAKASFAAKYGHEPVEIPVVISDGARKL